mgnify:CR=1 FL=1
MTDPFRLLGRTRRHFFRDCGVGLGSIALSSLLAQDKPAASADPLAPKTPHHRPKAKSIIYLFMAGGPSQLEFFDHKPKLNELNGQPIPASFIEGKRFAFMGSSHRVNLLGHDKKFKQHGQSGAWVSDMLPHTAAISDDLCFVKTCKTDLFNHAPAKLFMNTGSGLFGRPSMGAWMTYGLGSECADLPGFVVLVPKGMPVAGADNWQSSFLPGAFQGTYIETQDRKAADLIDHLTNTDLDPAAQRAQLDFTTALNRRHDRQNPAGGLACGQIAQGAAGGREIFGGNRQFGQQLLGFRIVRMQSCQHAKAFDPCIGGFFGLHLGKGGGKVGVGHRLPCFFQHTGGVFLITTVQITARGHGGGGDQVGRLFVGGDGGFLRVNAGGFVKHAFRLLQGKHGIAAAEQIFGQSAGFGLCRQGGARAFPIGRTRLQFQQNVLRFGVAGFQLKRLFRQFQRGVGIAFGQLLLQQAANAHKAGARISQ